MSLQWRAKRLFCWGIAGRFGGTRGQTGSRLGTLDSAQATEKTASHYPVSSYAIHGP
jgi:hypothetical protein